MAEKSRFGTLEVEHSVVINRPVEEVFEYVANLKNAPEWIAGVTRMEQTSDGEMGVGARGKQVRQYLGQQIEGDWEITEYVPNKKISLQVLSGPVAPFGVAESFEPIDRGTLVTFVGQGEQTGIFKLAVPVLARIYRKQLDADFTTLKYLLESRAALKGFLPE